jgi:hypothetical protein
MLTTQNGTRRAVSPSAAYKVRGHLLKDPVVVSSSCCASAGVNRRTWPCVTPIRGPDLTYLPETSLAETLTSTSRTTRAAAAVMIPARRKVERGPSASTSIPPAG